MDFFPFLKTITSPLKEDAQNFARHLEKRFAYYHEGAAFDATYLTATALTPATCQYLEEHEIRTIKRIILSAVSSLQF